MEIPASLTLSEIKYEIDKLPHIFFFVKDHGEAPSGIVGVHKI